MSFWSKWCPWASNSSHRWQASSVTASLWTCTWGGERQHHEAYNIVYHSIQDEAICNPAQIRQHFLSHLLSDDNTNHMEGGSAVWHLFLDEAYIDKKKSHPYERWSQYRLQMNIGFPELPVKSVYRMQKEFLLRESDGQDHFPGFINIRPFAVYSIKRKSIPFSEISFC